MKIDKQHIMKHGKRRKNVKNDAFNVFDEELNLIS